MVSSHSITPEMSSAILGAFDSLVANGVTLPDGRTLGMAIDAIGPDDAIEVDGADCDVVRKAYLLNGFATGFRGWGLPKRMDAYYPPLFCTCIRAGISVREHGRGHVGRDHVARNLEPALKALASSVWLDRGFPIPW